MFVDSPGIAKSSDLESVAIGGRYRRRSAGGRRRLLTEDVRRQQQERHDAGRESAHMFLDARSLAPAESKRNQQNRGGQQFDDESETGFCVEAARRIFTLATISLIEFLRYRISEERIESGKDKNPSENGDFRDGGSRNMRKKFCARKTGRSEILKARPWAAGVCGTNKMLLLNRL